MGTCLIMYLFSIASIAMATTTPSIPTSTGGMMVSNMQLMGGQMGGSWNGMNGGGLGRGMTEYEAFQAILRTYNISLPTGINPAMNGGRGGMHPGLGWNNDGMSGMTRTGGIMIRRGGGRGADLGGGTGNWGGTNGRIGIESGGIGGTNSGMEWPSGGMGPMNSRMAGTNGRGLNSRMGWQGGNGAMGGVMTGQNGGMNIGMNQGMGSGGGRSNVDKSIRTQATLNSNDGALLQRAGNGCTQDWTHVNGGVDPFCIRLLIMYPNRGL